MRASTGGTDGAACLHGPQFVDTHVHLHPCFADGRFFSSAADSFERAARRLGSPRISGVLCFTESAGANEFVRLRGLAGASPRNGWSLESTLEEDSLVARRGDATLVLIAGRQIVACERLEVLALATDAVPEDHRGLGGTIETVAALGGISVIPWGFGKWWFRRGQILRELLRAAPTGLFFADNGGRAGILREPRLMAAARSAGVWVLAGSDPLSYPDQIPRVGSFGVVLDGDLSLEKPAADLRGILHCLTEDPARFGGFAGLRSFTRTQARVHLRSRSDGER